MVPEKAEYASILAEVCQYFATMVAAEHAAVAAAVVAGDAPGAAAAMRTHLRNSARRFLEESTGRPGA